jgi:glycosyltransferase involved in cell wall biosynthesis
MEAATLDGRRVLYVSYNGMLEPLGQSQVIPYLKELSKLGVKFWLMSFERASSFTAEGIEASRRLRDELSAYDVEWHVLRYHQKPSLPATAYDVTAGIRYGSRLVQKNKIEMVHARAHIPAVIALALKRRFGVKIVFDVRGLMAEEYVDADHWKANGVPARLTKSMEARVLRSAEGVVTLTDALWAEMQNWPSLSGRSTSHLTIPCCVDLDKFRFDEEQRAARRAQLGLGDRLVLVYSGSVGGWYMTDEMAAFFAALKQKKADAFFLWVTHGPQNIVSSAMQKHGIGKDDYEVRKGSPGDMPGYLSAADAGIAFYRPGVSRLGTSPVKVSEYLACGLPVVMNSGIGDSDSIIMGEHLGVLAHKFDEAEYAKAAAQLDGLIAESADTRRQNRAAAERLFDLKQIGATRYAKLYTELLGD